MEDLGCILRSLGRVALGVMESMSVNSSVKNSGESVRVTLEAEIAIIFRLGIRAGNSG